MKNGKIKMNVKKCYKKLSIDCINEKIHFSILFCYHNALVLNPKTRPKAVLIT